MTHAGGGTLVGVRVTGPPDRRFDLVVVADGFAADRIGAFQELVAALHRELIATEPFSTLRGALNLWRLDRTGPEDLAAVLEPGGGRLLTVDAARARDVAGSHGVVPDAVLVFVDLDQYAGSGVSGVAVVSSHADAPRLALHELGHAAFDLADEYGGPGPAASGPGEPARVNVTRQPDPRLVKWADLVTGDGEVGCVEGGDRTDRGIYRPTRTCLMRSVGQPFCPVCRRQVTKVLLTSLAGRPGT